MNNKKKPQKSWRTTPAIFRAENICKFLYRFATKISQQDIFPGAVLPQPLVILYWPFQVLSSPENWSSPGRIAEKSYVSIAWESLDAKKKSALSCR